MTKQLALATGFVCVGLGAALVALFTGAWQISAPVAIPVLVMVACPMVAAAALIATCSLVGTQDVRLHADAEVSDRG